nr:putative ribonuclease H-like domain-containing protein [Tanacetum cinerariifolium]
MTLETHNWSSSAHQELHKIVKDEIFPIVNQVDASVQNFEIQFLKEATKFVGDFKSLAKEDDESLAKHKALKLEIERLLRAVVSQDIMFIVQKASVVDTSNLQTELERVDNTKTRRPQPRSNTKNDRVTSASKSSQSKNKGVKKQTANVSIKEKQKKRKPKVKKPKKVGFIERLATPKPSLPKFKYHKEHLCPSCEQGKSKRASHPPKPVPNSRQRLHLLHMDLCGPMRIASINGKRYVLVIVDDYSRYTWVQFLRSKDEAPKVIKTFLKRITVLLQSPVIIIRTDNGTEFKNQVLKEYFDSVGISHELSSVRTPQQNGVVERINRMLVEAARTMLIFFRAPLFLWAEAIATACFTQNRSIIYRHFNKTPYELINGGKPDISFLYDQTMALQPHSSGVKIQDLMLNQQRYIQDESS